MVGVPTSAPQVVEEQSLVLNYRGKTLKIGKDNPSLSVGRVASNDLMVPTDLTSRNHAEIECRNGHFHLTDMSSNGTVIVDGRGQEQALRREGAMLRDNGKICFGGVPSSNPDGLVDCWGRNDESQLSQPTTGAWTTLSAGWRHTCGLLADGQVACWGDDTRGQAAAPSGGGWTSVAAGQSHSCGIDATGALACWGDDTAGQSAPPTGDGWVTVTAGADFNCALDAAGSLTCWGANDAGQLDAPAGAGWVDVSAGPGGRHACALGPAGALECWGADDWGQAQVP